MRPRASWLAVVACAVMLAVGARAQEIWRIGEFDHSYDEFACARNYSSFAASFPNDITYRIGTSQPKRDWSFVHPGPADYWAGSRVHPFTIEFDLPQAPATPLRLRIALVDVQSQLGTSLVVKIGDATGTFRLRNGTNEGSLYDPANGRAQEVSAQLPAAMFHAGLNRIVLTSTGSWFLYDAVSLTSEAAGGKPKVKSLTLEQTVLLKRIAGGGLGQVVLARVEVEGPAEVPTLTVDAAGAKVSAVTALPIFGTLEQEVVVPEVKAPMDVTVTATVGESTSKATVKLTPVRHWRIFMAPSVHTDIGYTDLQANVAKRHNENTDRAIAMCEKYPAFDWNLETAWQADEYERARTPEQSEKLWALARAGRIGVQASYLNMLTGLCSSEELDRWLYYAASLKRKHGVPMESALISDVPTQTWGVATTLAAAGVRYFATGINTTRAYGFTKLMSLFPYWWEGPDGSRVLAYFAPGYGQAGGALRTFDDLRGWVLAATRNQASFPYDALFLYGAIGDNGSIEEGMGPTAQQWADTYEFPKVIVGTNADYFRYMEKTYGPKLPVVRGDGGAYWEDGAGSSAVETAANRRAHETASAADALWAAVRWTAKTGVPKGGLSDLWRNILLFDEHTWGAYNSISEPDAKFVTDQWKVKQRFALRADSDSWDLMDDGLGKLLPLVRTKGPGVLIFNATGWEREGEAVVACPEEGMVAADPETGRPLPAAGMYFRAPKVPAWGYAVCPLVKGSSPEAAPQPITGPAMIENEYLRLTLDPASGGVASLVDKKTGRELVDQTAPYKLNEYLYVSGGDGTNIVDLGANKPADLTIHRASATKLWRTVYPGLGVRLTVGGAAEKTPGLLIGYTLWKGCPRLDIRNTLTRTPERKKEAAYFAFPFAAANPQWRLEIPNGVMRPEIDQLPGACKEWFAIQHFARLTSKEGNLAFASLDAPLVCLGDINRGRWPEKLDLKNGWLFSYVMNNYWFTNYKADQGGPVPMSFEYSITTQAATYAEAARFGWQASMMLQRRLIEKAQAGPLPSSGSFCRAADGSPSAVAPEGVIITAIKAPEDGRGVIVRLLSMETKPVVARLTVGLPDIKSATLCNLVEEPIGPLKMDGAVVSVPVRPFAPTTVLLR